MHQTKGVRYPKGRSDISDVKSPHGPPSIRTAGRRRFYFPLSR